MILGKPYKFLDEAATQDLMDPATSGEVKDTVEELEDVLTNNVEEVKDSKMVSNGGVPVTTAESAVLFESKGQYYVAMEAVMTICEDEAAADSESEDPTPEEVADKAPDVIEQIADANNVDADDITVVISKESAMYLVECALNESKCGKKDGKAAKKVKGLSKVAEALKGKIKVLNKK